MPFSCYPGKLLSFGFGIQLLPKFLQVMDLGCLRNVPLYPEVLHQPRQFLPDLCSQFCEFLFCALFPHKAVPVRVGFDLCPINEHCRQTYKTPLCQHSHKLLQQFFFHALQPLSPKPRDRVVIRRWIVLQQIHKADVLTACPFDLPRTIDQAQVPIHQDFQQNPRRIFVSPVSGVGALDLFYVHPFHYGAYQSHWIICCDKYFCFHR